MRRYLRYIAIALFAFLSVVTFISCPAAPPVDPMEQYNPNGAPPAPKNVKATNGYEGKITITWDPVETATSYQIWKIENTKYGTNVGSDESLGTINKLQQRGFSLVQSVTADTTEYTIDQTGNKGFVFSVVAVRKPGESNSSSQLLYSEPSEYVEGGTLAVRNSIDISGIGNANQININWSVPNIFSILSNDQIALYPYDFTIEYRDPNGTGEWETARSGITDFSTTLTSGEFGFGVDTTVYFRINMNVYEDNSKASVVNTPYSVEYPILTDSKLDPQPILSIKASQGSDVEGIILEWTAPKIPNGAQVKNVFEIERKIESSGSWEVVLTGEESANAASSSGTTWTWNDKSANTNTKYVYRITNGYMNSDGAIVYEETSDDKKLISNTGWRLYIPENIKFSVLSSDVSSATVEIKWDYETTANVGWKLSIIDWSQKTGQTTTKTENISTNNNAYSLKLTNNDEYFHRYSFQLIQTFNGAEVNKFDVINNNSSEGNFVGIGNEVSSNVINSGSLKATTNFVGIVRLSWTVVDDPNITNEEYSVYIDGGNAVPVEVKSSGMNRYADISSDGKHTYMISCSALSNGIQIEDICPDHVEGNILSAPSNFKASKGTFADKIKFSWTGDTSDAVKYELYRKGIEESDDKWSIIEFDSENDNYGYINSANDGTDGISYDFKLRSYNLDQIKADSSAFVESAVDQGSVFGTAGMNTSATMGTSPNEITLTWNPVAGASHYLIYRSLPSSYPDDIEDMDEIKYDDLEFEQLAGQVGGKLGEYVDVDICTMESTSDNLQPLSETYYYQVVPVMSGGTAAKQEGITPVPGSLFGPPKDVTASKGEITNSIEISWKPVNGAKSYMIQRTISGSSSPDIGYVSGKQVVANYDANRDVYYINEDFASFNEYSYTVCAVKDDMQSAYQNGFKTVTTLYGDQEAANLGYPLVAPSTLRVESVKDSSGYYAPYVRYTWPRSKGATTYILHNSVPNSEDVVLDVSIYHNNKWHITDSNAVGYLSYNDGIYTYNDGSYEYAQSGNNVVENRGNRTTQYEFSNAIKAGSKNNDVTGFTEDTTLVTRALNATEYVNFVNNILQNPLKDVDNEEIVKEIPVIGGTLAGDKKKFDWWLYALSDNSWEYPAQNNNLIIHLESEGGKLDYNPGINYLKLNGFSENGMILTTQTNIQFDVDEGSDGSSIGADYLILLGYNGNGLVNIEFDNMNKAYKPASIKYNNIFIYVSDYNKYTDNEYGSFGVNKGVYTVNIEGIEYKITDTENIIRPLISDR